MFAEQAKTTGRLGVRGRKDQHWRLCTHIPASHDAKQTSCGPGHYRMLLHDGKGSSNPQVIAAARLEPEPKGRTEPKGR